MGRSKYLKDIEAMMRDLGIKRKRKSRKGQEGNSPSLAEVAARFDSIRKQAEDTSGMFSSMFARGDVLFLLDMIDAMEKRWQGITEASKYLTTATDKLSVTTQEAVQLINDSSDDFDKYKKELKALTRNRDKWKGKFEKLEGEIEDIRKKVDEKEAGMAKVHMELSLMRELCEASVEMDVYLKDPDIQGKRLLVPAILGDKFKQAIKEWKGMESEDV